MTQVTSMTTADNSPPVIASNFRRFAAFLVDGSMTYASFGVALRFTQSVGVSLRFWFWTQTVAILHFLLAGTTLGKRLLGIRQIQVRGTVGRKTVQRVGIFVYLFNVLCVRPVISSFTLGLSLIWPLFDADGQFLADKLLGVYTVTADSLEKHERAALKPKARL